MEPLREKSLRPFVQHLFGDIMSVEETGRVRAKQQDHNIALLLSQYFRKDLKQSDSVPEDIDIAILEFWKLLYWKERQAQTGSVEPKKKSRLLQFHEACQ